MDYAKLKEITSNDIDILNVSEHKDGKCVVEVAERAGGYYDPNALAIYSLDGEHLGYVGKKDPLRLRMLAKAKQEELTLPVLIANYHKEGDEKLWDTVQEGDLIQLWLRALSLTPVNDTTFQQITSFTEEEVLWSEHLHICTDLKGNELLGGSTYASQFEKDFDSENIAKAYAKKNELKTEDVLAYWKSLGDLSTDYGTSIHRALEHYSKYFKLVGHERALPRQTHLREAVKEYLRVSNFDNCVAEPLITDVDRGMSGWVDNLRFEKEGLNNVVIEDYKTNTFNEPKDYYSKWPPKLKYYKRQLDFYGTILENHGYTVKGLVVWHWHEGKWGKHALKFDKVKEYAR